MNKRHHEDPGHDFWTCPYCPVTDEEDPHPYSGQREVVRHIDSSNAKSHGEEHDALKREDGWYMKTGSGRQLRAGKNE